MKRIAIRLGPTPIWLLAMIFLTSCSGNCIKFDAKKDTQVMLELGRIMALNDTIIAFVQRAAEVEPNNATPESRIVTPELIACMNEANRLYRRANQLITKRATAYYDEQADDFYAVVNPVLLESQRVELEKHFIDAQREVFRRVNDPLRLVVSH